MKYLGKKSASHVLKIMLNVFWVFGWLALIGMSLPTIYSIFINYKGLLNAIFSIGINIIILNIIFIIYQLRKITNTLIGKNPFSISNVSKFRYIGYSTLIIGILLLTKDIYFKGFNILTILDAGPGYAKTNIEIYIPFILGILSLILAEIFKIGYEIHEENKLTI